MGLKRNTKKLEKVRKTLDKDLGRGYNYNMKTITQANQGREKGEVEGMEKTVFDIQMAIEIKEATFDASMLRTYLKSLMESRGNVKVIDLKVENREGRG